MIRLVLFCQSEHIISQANATRLLERIAVAADEEVSVESLSEELFTRGVVQQLQDRLLRYHEDLEMLPESLGVRRLSAFDQRSPELVGVPLSDSNSFSLGEDNLVIEDDPNVEFKPGVSRDLQVNFWGRFVIPILVLCVLGLVTYVVLSFDTFLEYLDKQDRKSRPYSSSRVESTSTLVSIDHQASSETPDGGGSIQNDEGEPANAVEGGSESQAESDTETIELGSTSVGPSASVGTSTEADEKLFDVTDIVSGKTKPTPEPEPESKPTLRLIDAQVGVEKAVARRDWEEAFAIIDSVEDLPENQLPLKLWKAGVWLASGEDAGNMRALQVLADERSLRDSAAHRRLYAAALIRSSRVARATAVMHFRNVDSDDMNEDARVAQDWAQARDGKSLSELPELLRRSADFETSELDELFLSFVFLRNGDAAGLAKHLKTARDRLNEFINLPEEPFEPVWLRDMADGLLQEALKLLQSKLSELETQ